MNYFKLQLRLLTLFLFGFFSSIAQPCQVVEEATKLYEVGDFEKIIQLEAPVDKLGRFTGCTKDMVIELWRLKAEAYAVTGHIDKAKQVIEEILQLKQNFETNYTHSDRFQSLFEWVKRSSKDEIITSVSKWKDSLYIAPAQVTIITGEEIIHRGYRHLGELFYDIAGFDVTEVSGNSTVYMKGIRTPEQTEGILLMLDGVKQNGIWTQEIFLNGLYALSNIDRVEIIYGSLSAVYGIEAFSGVINIVTKKMDDLLPNQERLGLVGAVSRNIIQSSDNAPKERTDIEFSTIMDFKYKSSLSISLKGSTENRTNLLETQLAEPYQIKPLSVYNTVLDTPALNLTEQAMALDSIAYNTLDSLKSGLRNNVYWHYTTKFNVDKFELGGAYLYFREEQGELFEDRRRFGIASSNKRLEEGYFYFKYNQFITNSLQLNLLSRYQVENVIYAHSRVRSFDARPNATLDENDLKIPFVEEQKYTAHSYEFTNELDVNYRFSNHLTMQAGIEYRSGGVQGNLVVDESQYHIFSENFDLGNFNFQNYLNDNIGGYFHINFRVPRVKALTLTATLRADYFRIRPNSFSYQRDKYYEDYANYFHTYYYDAGGYQNDNFYEYVDTTLSNIFIPEEFDIKINNYRGIYNPRFVVVYSPQLSKNDYLTLKASYTQGFKTVSQRQRLGLLSSNILNNPFNYSPAESEEGNFQIKYQKINGNHRASVSMSVYYTDINQMIDLNAQIPIINPDVIIEGTELQNYTTYNLTNYVMQGGFVEWNYTYEFGKATQISTFGNYTYSDSKEKGQDFTVAGIATHQLNLGLNTVLLNNRLNFNIRMNYVGDRSINEGTSLSFGRTVEIPAYTRINAAATFHWKSTGLSFQVAVNNLFNQTIYHTGLGPADGIYYQDAILQNGRIVTGRVYYDLNKKVSNQFISFLK